MAVKIRSKTGRHRALALALAAVVLPGIASAEPGGEDRGHERGRGRDTEAPGNIGASGWQQPAARPQQNWGGNDSGRGNYARPEPAPQAAPAPNPNWSGERRGRGDWNRGESAQVTPAPQPPQQRWNGGESSRGGAGWNRPAPGQYGWNGSGAGWQPGDRDQNRGRDGDRDRDRARQGNRERDRDGDRWRGNEPGRRDGWNGNRGWNGNNGWNGGRDGYNQDYRRWDNRWRGNDRYDWHSYRRGHPQIYRMQPYYAPYRGYSYRRLGIGFFLDTLFFARNYWIDDPWSYRLPDVYGPYRWVRYYDDALLVNVYSGEVVDVIYDFFW